jgi:isoamylase
MNREEKTGKSFPLGSTMCAGGVNFSVFAKGGQAVQLLLFDLPDDAQPSRTITLDPVSNRSRHYWHVFVPGIEVGQILQSALGASSPRLPRKLGFCSPGLAFDEPQT